MLISRHRDGEINAIAAERLGVGTVRGSGSHEGDFHRKGGVPAFKAMVSALEEGYNMALTADVPKVSRVAGLGIIMLARLTGRPIVPVVIATSRFKRLNNWDRSIINLPFGRGVLVAGDLIEVPRRCRPGRDGSRARASRARPQRHHQARLRHDRARGRPHRRAGQCLSARRWRCRSIERRCGR